jgi:hypothetical protein
VVLFVGSLNFHETPGSVVLYFVTTSFILLFPFSFRGKGDFKLDKNSNVFFTTVHFLGTKKRSKTIGYMTHLDKSIDICDAKMPNCI